MEKKKLLLSALFVVAVTFAALSPSLFCGFTNWDDQIMITQNEKIMGIDWNHIKIWFTTFHERLYHPLVHMSYAIEYHFFGMNPHVFHATSLLLHLFNTAFVFWFIFMLSKNRLAAIITALLFGIHPMHVESVVWLPERKDVLYTFFFMGSLISYLYFLKDKQRKFYYISMLAFVLSLMSKSMAMTLPLILLLCDYLLNVKIDKENLLDKLPFFSFSLLFGFLTILGHYEPGVKGREFAFSFIGNIVSACQNIVFYLIKLVWPFKLSCIYLAPDKMQHIPQFLIFLAPLIVVALLSAALYSGKFSKIGIFGSLFFLIAIAPVTQILPVGLVVPADRYTYVSYIGLFYIFAEGFRWAYDRYDKKMLAWAITVLFLLLAVLSFMRTLVYRDPISIWDDVIKNYSNIPLAYYNRGDEYYLKMNNYEKAMPDFQQAIAIDPKYVESYINIGLIYYFKHDYPTAISWYNRALKLSDTMPETYMNRGNSLSAQGKNALALSDYNTALKLRPGYIEGWYNRGNIYLKMGEYKKAISDFEHAVKLKTAYSDAYNNLGNAYFRMGDLDNAYLSFSQCLWLNPYDANAYYNRAVVSSMKGNAAAALSDVLKSQKLGNNVDPAVIEKLQRAIEREKE